jgi:pilus assembly protein FimV
VDTGNSSFLTDFDKTGPGSIDTDEVDPVAEAEVYIAYGRDAQAEEILKEAMSRDKSRHEITVKLLEIYHARKSVQAFETVARELKDAIGSDNPMWAKVAAMGASIDPQNALYSGSGQAYETTGAFSTGGASVMAADAADKAPPDVDFDLGFTDSNATSPAPISAFDVTSPNSGQPAGGGMDFDLDLNTGTAAESPAGAAAGAALDFDLALDAPAAPAAGAPAVTPSSGFDFDLSSLSLESSDAAKPAVATDFSKTIATHAPAAEKSGMPSLADLSLDLDDVPGGGAGEGPSAVSTKLELAKAYIEIGDSEGAKEILTEVSREGSPAQQAEAKKILAGM